MDKGQVEENLKYNNEFLVGNLSCEVYMDIVLFGSSAMPTALFHPLIYSPFFTVINSLDLRKIKNF